MIIVYTVVGVKLSEQMSMSCSNVRCSVNMNSSEPTNTSSVLLGQEGISAIYIV